MTQTKALILITSRLIAIFNLVSFLFSFDNRFRPTPNPRLMSTKLTSKPHTIRRSFNWFWVLFCSDLCFGYGFGSFCLSLVLCRVICQS